MTSLRRGEIYYITFPYTADPRYPDGKSKFVLVLQEGDYFRNYDTTEILLVTKDKEGEDCKERRKYPTDIFIPKNTTKLDRNSWITCAQPYPVKKSLFEASGCWCAGKLSASKMDEVDKALFLGLCMGIQRETEIENSIPIEA
jgi:mRNA-degrading endonuclease toxin of MazEF toxin-antitoxin module